MNFKTSGYYMKLDKMEACEGTLKSPVVYEPAQIFLKGDEAIVNYNVTVKRPISSDLEVSKYFKN